MTIIQKSPFLSSCDIVIIVIVVNVCLSVCVCVDDAELQSNHQAEQLPVAEQDSKRFGQVTDAEAVHTYLFIHWSTCCPAGGVSCFHDSLVPTGIVLLVAVATLCDSSLHILVTAAFTLAQMNRAWSLIWPI